MTKIEYAIKTVSDMRAFYNRVSRFSIRAANHAERLDKLTVWKSKSGRSHGKSNRVV